MQTPAVPLVAHFTGLDGTTRIASLRVVMLNDAGTPFVVYGNRITPIFGIKDPDFKFSALEYVEIDDPRVTVDSQGGVTKVGRPKKTAEPEKAE